MPEINVIVKCSNDTKYTIPIDTEKTVLEFKEAIATKTDTPAERQRLIYSGRVLKDEQVLDTYKIQEGHTVHMVKGAAPASSATTSSGGVPAAATVPQNMQAGQQVNNPLAGLAGAFPGGAFPGGANPFAMLGGSGGPSGPAADPNAIANMFANPQFAQTMSSMLSNPQVLDSIINMNPQLRAMGPEVRQMMQSEEFRRAMSDPNTLRNMAQMSAAMGQMGGMPGMPGFGMGAGNSPSFPAPGATNTTPSSAPSSTTASTGATSPSGGAPPVNPFASLLNPGAGGNVPTSSPLGGGAGSMFDPGLFETYMRTMGGMGGLGGLGALGGLGGAGSPGSAPAPADTRPPEERFQTQLQQLNDMGFWEASSNIRALQMTGGNVSAAIEYLLNNPGPGA